MTCTAVHLCYGTAVYTPCIGGLDMVISNLLLGLVFIFLAPKASLYRVKYGMLRALVGYWGCMCLP